MSKRVTKNHYNYSDEEFSPEDNDIDTAVSGRKPPKHRPGKKMGKKSSRRPGSPNKSRSHSAPPSRPGREHWMAGLKKMQTLGVAQGKPPESPRHKTPIEYWVDTLRKTGVGISTESTGMNTFTGLKKKNDINMAYLSSPHYLRQMFGTEKSRRHGEDPTAKPTPGTPAYKTPEEYYDEVLGLRKQIATLNNEITTMRAKNRRLEEDKIKKDKELEGLLNPGKSDEIRRTLGDRNPDSAAVIHSLKQKILKLEMQLRDRESTVSKLQSDLKTTKVEELRTQMEIFYQEMLRLQQSKETGVAKSARGGKDSTVKVRALNETVLRLNQQNQQLAQENRALKDDLKKALDDAEAADGSLGEYEDMNRKQLLRVVNRLDKKLSLAERKLEGDADSIASLDSQRATSKDKLVLRGSLEERLQQLDQRETELLDEVAKLKATVKRLREERAAKKDDRRSSLPPQPSPRQSFSRGGSRPPTGSGTRPLSSGGSRPPSAAGSRPLSAGSSRSARRLADEEDRYREQQARITQFQENRAAKTIQRGWHKHRDVEREQARRVQDFTEQRAARRIQHGWIDYKGRKHDAEMDDVAYLLQGTMRGNSARKHRLTRTHSSDYETDSTDREELNEASYQIASAFQAHRARKTRMQTFRQDSFGEDEVYTNPSRRASLASRRPSSASRRPSAASMTRPGSGYKRTFQVNTSPSMHDDLDDF